MYNFASFTVEAPKLKIRLEDGNRRFPKFFSIDMTSESTIALALAQVEPTHQQAVLQLVQKTLASQFWEGLGMEVSVIVPSKDR